MSLNIPFDYKEKQKLNIGLTNNNYLVDINDKKYIVRVPRIDVSSLFNRDNEKIVLDKLKNSSYTIEPLHYDKGIQVVEYIQNLQNFDEYDKSDKIIKTANLMKEFHNSNIKVDFSFNPLDMIQKYYKLSKDIEINLADYHDLFVKLSEHKFTSVLCHNDWVAGNICFVNDETYLIDFEYAGNNDPNFDIMSFITENDLSTKEKKLFLKEMFPNGVSTKHAEILCMYRDINNILWYLWANMMYDLRKEAIYKEISSIKLKQLKKEYNTPLINFI